MRFIIVSAGLLLTTVAAAQDRDPAEIACEVATIKTLKAPKSFERVDSTVTGHRVILTYDAVNEYNAPLRHLQDCEFFVSEPGKISLVPLNMRQMIRAAKDVQRQVAELKTQADAERVQKAATALQLQTTTEMMKAITVTAAIKKETTYPIPVEATQIKPLEKMPSPDD